MKKPDNIHPLIGPHEGRELELTLAGEKPAAMFYYVIGKEEYVFEDVFAAFQPYVDDGTIVKKERVYSFKNHPMKYIFYAFPSNQSNIDRLIEIVDFSYDSSRQTSWPTQLERETGRLLGYSDEAIEFFINRRHIM